MKMNKKGGQILSVYWFAILFIVAAAIVYMVVSFYGNPYDIRAAEANAMTNKIANCISTGGYFNQSILKTNTQDFLKTCGINFTTEDVYNWGQQGQYYLNVSIINFTSNKIIFQTAQGNVNLKDSCSQQGSNLPVCLRRSFYSVDKDNNQYVINITSIIRKTEKNVR